MSKKTERRGIQTKPAEETVTQFPGAAFQAPDPAAQPLAPAEAGEGRAPAPVESDLDGMIAETTLIAEIQGHLRQAVATHYELGRCFCALKERTEHGRFLQILRNDLWGLSYDQAKRNMLFYRKCNELPRLKDFAEKNFSKALTLFHGLEDEELAQIEDGSHATISVSDLETWSVRKLKAEVKRLQKPVEEVVKEETKALEQERDALIQERDAALAQIRTDTPESLKLALDSLKHKVRELRASVDRLQGALPEDADPADKAQYSAQLHAAITLLQDAWDRYIEDAETA